MLQQHQPLGELAPGCSLWHPVLESERVSPLDTETGSAEQLACGLAHLHKETPTLMGVGGKQYSASTARKHSTQAQRASTARKHSSAVHAGSHRNTTTHQRQEGGCFLHWHRVQISLLQHQTPAPRTELYQWGCCGYVAPTALVSTAGRDLASSTWTDAAAGAALVARVTLHRHQRWHLGCGKRNGPHPCTGIHTAHCMAQYW